MLRLVMNLFASGNYKVILWQCIFVCCQVLMPTALVSRARIMELAFSIPVRQIIILATVLLVLLERIVAVSINFTS